jgi:hypothetical protein
MMLRDFIAGVVIEDGQGLEGVDRAIIFDDDTWYDFYSCQQISGDTFIELSGVNALYRSMRETSMGFNA